MTAEQLTQAAKTAESLEALTKTKFFSYLLGEGLLRMTSGLRTLLASAIAGLVAVAVFFGFTSVNMQNKVRSLRDSTTAYGVAVSAAQAVLSDSLKELTERLNAASGIVTKADGALLRAESSQATTAALMLQVARTLSDNAVIVRETLKGLQPLKGRTDSVSLALDSAKIHLTTLRDSLKGFAAAAAADVERRLGILAALATPPVPFDKGMSLGVDTDQNTLVLDRTDPRNGMVEFSVGAMTARERRTFKRYVGECLAFRGEQYRVVGVSKTTILIDHPALLGGCPKREANAPSSTGRPGAVVLD